MIAQVETEGGEMLDVQYPDHSLGGDAVLEFLIGLSQYCAKDQIEELHWFTKLQTFTQESLCSIGQPLISSFYSGDEWANWNETDYEAFRRQHSGIEISEDEFKSNIRHIAQRWTPLQEMIQSANSFLQLFAKCDLESSPWYHPEITTPDLEALSKTLVFFNDRGVDKARIRFI